MHDNLVDPGERENLCFNCIKEAYLRREVEVKGCLTECDYCGEFANSITLDALSKKIEGAFEQHYNLYTEGDDIFFNNMFAEPVLSAIQSSAEIPLEAAKDILEILSANHYDMDDAINGYVGEFDKDSYYERRTYNDDFWQAEWRNFEKSLKTDSRFFNEKGIRILNSIFEGIEEIKTYQENSLILEIGPDCDLSSLFRARVFQSETHLTSALEKPDKELGPVPSIYATNGRMNANGISVFYGANKIEVAIAEVRPPVGSKVLVGRFHITQKLRILDLTVFNNLKYPGSIFDPEYIEKLEKVTFLQTLSKFVTRPVMPNDSALEYLPTQAIADYLATNSSLKLDGIKYPSIQFGTNDYNVILFHKVASVKNLNLPIGKNIEVKTEEYNDIDGYITNYEVWYNSAHDLNSALHISLEDSEPKQNTHLELDLACIHVFNIENVRFDVSAYYVNYKDSLPTRYDNIDDN